MTNFTILQLDFNYLEILDVITNKEHLRDIILKMFLNFEFYSEFLPSNLVSSYGYDLQPKYALLLSLMSQLGWLKFLSHQVCQTKQPANIIITSTFSVKLSL